MLQRQKGLLVTHVEGEDHTGLFASRSEDWHTRRRILTPAFSAHKMKLVRRFCMEKECVFWRYTILHVQTVTVHVPYNLSLKP